MRQMLELIKTLEYKQDAVVYTVTEGEYPGCKALFAQGKMLWQSTPESFFAEHQEQLGAVRETGTFTLDGQQIFAELLGSETKLVVCGAGHVSIPIIRMGKMLGWEVTVLEDRPSFADNARREQPFCVLCEPFAEALDKIPGDEDTCFVIVTRGHRFDEVCLQKIVEKKHAYIGMMGSKRRVAAVRQHALEQGAAPEVMDQLHAPIGLAIGAETPEEIAVSILAEIIAVRNEKKRSLGYPKEILRAALDQEKFPGDKVLATIIRRRGSAPRSVGTKMLVHADGSCTGTIGGGCMEAAVRQRALGLLHNDGKKALVCTVDLCASAAEEEGMVCGGVIEVLLEKIRETC